MKKLLFLLLALSLFTTACNDSCDRVDFPGPYMGPTGGEHHKARGADEDYCDC